MKRKSRCMLFVLLLGLAASANATSNDESLRTCVGMQDKLPSEKVLACYNQFAQEYLALSPEQKTPAIPAQAKRISLADEWTPSDELIHVYKQNYFLFYSQSSQPNIAPYSPNPKNQVAGIYPIQDKEMKFQISIKSHMLGENRHALWFGYSQLSFWQIYDSANSTPFRESNYEPELIYSFRPENHVRGGLTVSFLNAGIVHQSNGQNFPRSRSWNRQFIQIGMERDFGDYGRLALLPRWWKRIGGGTADDDNPDITNYLGNGDLEARYYYDKSMLSAIARIRSIQLDLAIPTPSMYGVLIRHSNFHLQFFDGYGESLIDYNQRHRTYGLGFSMPLE